MATPTYTPIESKTLGSNTAIVEFTSIPQTYTDLVLVINGKSDTSTVNVYAQVGNGSYDTGTNYSWTWLGGSGSTAASGRGSTTDALLFGASGTSSFSPTIIHFQNYSNTTTYKTMISRSSTADTTSGQTVSAWVGLWRRTFAINRIKLYLNVQNWVAGTTATLYGIANAAIGAPKAQGGIITYDSTYYYHTFGASGTFTPQQSLTADVLVIGGGGSGTGTAAAGGGAGGVVFNSNVSLASSTAYTCTVGAGGAYSSGTKANGVNSNVTGGSLSLTAAVGGGSGGIRVSGQASGNSGGSGGGGAGSSSYGTNTGGAETAGQGYAGGAGSTSALVAGGGGGAGGVGGAGGAVSTYYGGTGGVGTSTYSSWGLVAGVGQNVSGTVYFAGGGGGGSGGQSGLTPSSAGGYGGGGAGGFGTNTGGAAGSGVAGLANTGGGGGGGGQMSGAGSDGAGANGGSGVVIIRYLKA